MLGFSRLGDVVNLYVGMLLVPAVVSQERLGAILPLLTLAPLVAVPLSVVVQTALKYLNVFHVRGEHGKVKAILHDLGILTTILSALVFVFLWCGRGFILKRLKVDHAHILWLVAASGIARSCWMPVARKTSEGLRKFYSLIVSNVLGPVARLACILLLLRRFQLSGYLAANVASSLAVVLFLAWGIRRYWDTRTVRESYRSHWPEMLRYLLPIAVLTLSSTLQLAAEPWIIRQRLPTVDSAGYYVAAMFGMIPRYLSAAIVPFFFPLVSERFERGESTHRMHTQVLGAVLCVGGVVSLFLFFSAGWLLSLHSAWRPYALHAPFLWKVGAITTLTSFTNCHVLHENACRRFTYLWYYVPIVILEIGSLYGLMGWPVFRPWLPEGVWLFVNGLIVRDLQFIVSFMLGARLLTSLCVIVSLRGVWHNRGRSADGESGCAKEDSVAA